MTEIHISPIWKERIIYWCRDLIIVFSMWSIWLVRVYMPSIAQTNVVTGFLITIITITILLGEYYRVVDYTVRELDNELNRLKKVR